MPNDLTADEAIGIIRWHQESANTAPITAYSLTRGSVEAAEAAIRLAFAVLEEVEATIGHGHGCGQHWAAQVLETARARLECTTITEEE
jgi:bacterioferritin-associated ferredoxin